MVCIIHCKKSCLSNCVVVRSCLMWSTLCCGCVLRSALIMSLALSPRSSVSADRRTLATTLTLCHKQSYLIRSLQRQAFNIHFTLTNHSLTIKSYLIHSKFTNFQLCKTSPCSSPTHHPFRQVHDSSERSKFYQIPARYQIFPVPPHFNFKVWSHSENGQGRSAR